MTPMPVSRALFTRADYDRLPEAFLAKLTHGWLVKEPSPLYHHQRLAARLHQDLVAVIGPDLAPMTPVDVLIDDHNVFQPDVVALPEPGPDDDHYVPTPRLVVEFLSPSTRRRDRSIKTSKYLAVGVGEVWLVDTESRTVERHRRDGVAIAKGAEALESAEVAGFTVAPDRLFVPAKPPLSDRT